jgi:chromosome segregation ATPase
VVWWRHRTLLTLSGGDIEPTDDVDLLVARLWALEEELTGVKTKNLVLEGTVSTLTASLADSKLQNDLLHTDVEILTGKLKSSQKFLAKRKSDLRSKNEELSDVKVKLKESEQNKVTEVKRLTKMYKESSTDLHRHMPNSWLMLSQMLGTVY